MANHSVVTLNNGTATRITPNGIHSGLDISIQNVNASGYVYVGGEEVTTSNYGYRLAPNAAIAFELDGNDALYLVGSTNGLNAAVMTTVLVED
jgi:hypothetical protein